VDRTVLASCPVAGFGISYIELSASATTLLVRWILGRQVVKGGKWM